MLLRIGPGAHMYEFWCGEPSKPPAVYKHLQSHAWEHYPICWGSWLNTLSPCQLSGIGPLQERAAQGGGDGCEDPSYETGGRTPHRRPARRL